MPRFKVDVLPKLGPRALNSSGAVLGSSSENSPCAIHHPELQHWIWTPKSSVSGFDNLHFFRKWSWLWGVVSCTWTAPFEEEIYSVADLNDSGLVAATSRGAVFTRRAVLVEDGLVREVGKAIAAQTGKRQSESVSCNNRGWLLVRAGDDMLLDTEPLVWKDGRFEHLGAYFPRRISDESVGTRVTSLNDEGFVGATTLIDDRRRAAVLKGGKLVLFEQPEEDGASYFTAMNANGEAVGQYRRWVETESVVRRRSRAPLEAQYKYERDLVAAGFDNTHGYEPADFADYTRRYAEFVNAHPEITYDRSFQDDLPDPRVDKLVRPCRWSVTNRRQDLEIPEGFCGGIPNDINASSFAAGYLMKSLHGDTGDEAFGDPPRLEYHAAVWQPSGEAVLLNECIPPDSGLILTYAVSLNDSGQILCSGKKAGGSEENDDAPFGIDDSLAVLLTPVSEAE